MSDTSDSNYDTLLGIVMLGILQIVNIVISVITNMDSLKCSKCCELQMKNDAHAQPTRDYESRESFEVSRESSRNVP